MKIAVVGPPSSGATSLAAALGARLADHPVVEGTTHDVNDGAGLEADVVVFVVSAAAPITCSDVSLLDAAARRTDAVIAVVTKIDVHRTWRDVLVLNRTVVSDHAARYRSIPWIGVAAAPAIGAPELDGLAAEVRRVLSRGDLARRNALRVRCSRLAERVAEAEREEQRRSSLRNRQLLTVQSAQARVQLAGRARAMCAALRVEFHQVPSRGAEAFRIDVERRVAQLCEELDAEATRRLSAFEDCDSAQWPGVILPPVRLPGSENRLSILVGLGFGLGSAATVDRLITEFAPMWTTAAAPGCLAVGAAIGACAVQMRRTIAVRAALDRWVTEVAAALRAAFEEMIVSRFLAVETKLRAGAVESGDDRGAVPGSPLKVLLGELAGVRRQLGEPA